MLSKTSRIENEIGAGIILDHPKSFEDAVHFVAIISALTNDQEIQIRIAGGVRDSFILATQRVMRTKDQGHLVRINDTIGQIIAIDEDAAWKAMLNTKLAEQKLKLEQLLQAQHL